jgi:hypothetical protein
VTFPTPNSMPGAAAANPAAPAAPAAPAPDPDAPAAPPAAPAPAPAPEAPAAPAAPPAPPAAPPVAPPADPAPAIPPALAPPAQPATPPAAVPENPWGADFDAPRAWHTIQTQRAEIAALQQSTGARERDQLQTDLSTSRAQTDTWRTTAIRSKAEALAAAGSFVDTETVLLHLGDLSAFVGTDGQTIDETKLTTRLGELAQQKPFLLAAQGFTPNPAQGQSGNGGPLTAAQVAANAEAQQDWKAANAAKAHQLVQLRQSQQT